MVCPVTPHRPALLNRSLRGVTNGWDGESASPFPRYRLDSKSGQARIASANAVTSWGSIPWPA